MRYFIFSALLTLCIPTARLLAEGKESKTVKVGVASILSGDLGVLGQNVVDTVETYRKHYLKHPIEFYYEDAKLSGADGLSAYQKLINVNDVDMVIAGCSSNGTMAAKSLVNSTKTPTLSIVTGGHNIDVAGPFIFRIGNSDSLNGIQEADAFIKAGIKNVALLTEETEYTQDISKAFAKRFAELGGTLSYNDNFIPGTTDFRSPITLIKKSNPGAILMPTQTGTALGVFVKQWREQGGSAATPIHTSFVAAPNPDARKIAGDALNGVYYMAPEYGRDNPRMKEFVEKYQADHGHPPAIPFHSAGTVDSLDLLQAYLDSHSVFNREEFADWLLTHVKNYPGLMGTYSLDAEGNTNLGFSMAQIGPENNGAMK